jgi:hypothetical protein
MTSDSGLFRTAAELRKAGFVRDGTDWVLPEGLKPRQQALDLSGGRDKSSLALDEGRTEQHERYVPLYEAKMIHQFDHRLATARKDIEFNAATNDGEEKPEKKWCRDSTDAEKVDPSFEPTPRYFVPESEVASRLGAKGWTRDWLMGWRDITRNSDARTVIATVFPRVGVNHKTPIFFSEQPVRPTAALLANWLSPTFDYVARQKIGGTSLTFFISSNCPLSRPPPTPNPALPSSSPAFSKSPTQAIPWRPSPAISAMTENLSPGTGIAAQNFAPSSMLGTPALMAFRAMNCATSSTRPM